MTTMKIIWSYPENPEKKHQRYCAKVEANKDGNLCLYASDEEFVDMILKRCQIELITILK